MYTTTDSNGYLKNASGKGFLFCSRLDTTGLVLVDFETAENKTDILILFPSVLYINVRDIYVSMAKA